jgi:hypothetical protein
MSKAKPWSLGIDYMVDLDGSCIKINVTRADIEKLPDSKGWQLVEGYANDYKGDPMDVIRARIVPEQGFDRAEGITFAFLVALSQLFMTKNIDVETDMEYDYSDVTPGMGPSIEITIRPGEVP